MDIFRVLSRGAQVLKTAQNKKILSNTKADSNDEAGDSKLEAQVEKELDFFHVKKRANALKKQAINKQKTENDSESSKKEALPDLTPEEAAELRKTHGAKIQGDDVPLPVRDFEHLVTRYGLATNDKLVSNLLESGFVRPTPVQSEAIPIVLSDRDLVACAPTGSGKTLAFLVPLVIKMLTKPKGSRGLRCLIVLPTKDLAGQIHQELEKLTKGYTQSVVSRLLSKSMAQKLREDVVSSSKIDILVATPSRLVELLETGKVALTELQYLVFDEADKLFEGDFLKQADKIVSECGGQTAKLMFSATIPLHVENIAKTIMNEDCVRMIIGNKQAANLNIEQKLVFCGSEEGKLLEIRNMVLRGDMKPPVIIFLQSIVRAKALYHELLYDNIKLDVIHLDKTALQRQQALDAFKNGDIWVLICTDVLARGMDFKHVNLVINYDVPTLSASYIHRIGRTGRNGKKGTAVTFYTTDDVVPLKSIINVVKQLASPNNLQSWMENLGSVSKREKKKMRYREIERKKISTVPGVVVHKRKMKSEKIRHEKQKRQRTQENNED